ncbi:Stk1 family PASTA domain-containing Ser/Thr kinase [Paenibacillus bovis]|uniref:Serine/threonine-protein kinase PrkC n=1 Tax=Paenibacillus bovis TaxID=1616788 RepID=A0A172ZIY3_9BACL|nr:Stk1 family PASTA domain-containing Ser/Thr kinase [Paenibacillus bovis]ANF97606.1 serine/threonine protein kinase [Paenibacillus bovis]
MIGRILGGRYEVLEEIGGGGMALVYRAKDVLLNRHVAIKVLRQQFVYDEEFIRRFRREAQSAASLSHPNVVSIYDVGQEDDIHYIVMEYVNGQNLNEIIKERAPLPVEEAVRIATQICDALEHAHHNQIIHRDIKPHNILIGRNGRVKVTDFGIARAVTSTTITQTGSVIGSVHYFSPEHAKGVTTGEKSDLYSLGIVLYQMLTGRLPFQGESPISVALKHLQDEFEDPRLINPLIPQSVENIILKSMRKNPAERYHSAHDMLTDLDTCLLPERSTESRVYFASNDDDEQTKVVSAIRPNSIPVGLPDDEVRSMERDRGKSKTATASKQKSRKKAAIIISSVLAVLLIMFVIVFYVNQTLNKDEVTVPSVTNMTEQQAKVELQKYGLAVADDVHREYKEGIAPGTVYEQDPQPNTLVKQNTEIKLSVAMAKELKKMPDFTNSTYDDARKELIEMGFKDDQIARQDENNDSVEAGKVFDQKPGANEDVDPESQPVTLTVSKGVSTTSVPSVAGISQSDAQSKISSAGLKVGNVQQEASYTVDKGKVTRQNPQSGGSATKGSAVDLWISTGYPPEALNYTYTVSVPPATAGKTSKINIVYTDARGADRDWGTKTIDSRKSLQINMVLDPNQNGVVKVYRDGQFLDTFAIGYNEAKQGTLPEGVVEPENTGEVTPPPETTTPPAEETTPPEEQETEDPAAVDGSSNGNGNGIGNGNGNGQGNGQGQGNGNENTDDTGNDTNTP